MVPWSRGYDSRFSFWQQGFESPWDCCNKIKTRRKVLKAIEDKVIVQIENEQEKVSSSGLILTAIADEKTNIGTVIDVGPGIVFHNGDRLVPDISVGDKVVFAKYQGQEINHEGNDYLILSYKDVVAVIG